MKKRSLFLSGLLATSLLVGGVLVGCNQADDANDSIDSTDNTDNTDSTDSTDTFDTTTSATYNIAFSETNEVVATLSANEATVGTKIDITIVSVPDNYSITSITSDVSNLEIQAESETLYTFNMPESDVNLTINIEFVLGTNYKTGDTYIINTGDYPNDLQASNIYFELDGSERSLESINSSVYYYGRGITSTSIIFGIINIINIDNYSLSVSGYCYDKSAQQINIPFSDYSSGLSGIFWRVNGYNFLDGYEIYAAFITINRTSNT